MINKVKENLPVELYTDIFKYLNFDELSNDDIKYISPTDLRTILYSVPLIKILDRNDLFLIKRYITFFYIRSFYISKVERLNNYELFYFKDYKKIIDYNIFEYLLSKFNLTDQLILINKYDLTIYPEYFLNSKYKYIYFEYYKLPESLLKQYISNPLWGGDYKNSYKGQMIKHQKLSEDLIRLLLPLDKKDWNIVSSSQKLSENFIRENIININLLAISCCQKLSMEFINEFKSILNVDKMKYHQKSLH
jgi:hypothetical protein